LFPYTTLFRSREAGRDPSGLAVISCSATYVSDDVGRARDLVRSHGAMVGNHVAEVLRNSGPDSMPADLAAFVQDRPEYDYSRHVHQGAVHARYVPDEVIDRLCLVGPPEEC